MRNIRQTIRKIENNGKNGNFNRCPAIYSENVNIGSSHNQTAQKVTWKM